MSVRETGSFSLDYDGYNEELFNKVQQLRRVVSDRGIVFVEADSHDLSLTRRYMEQFFTRRCFVEEFIVPIGYNIGSQGGARKVNYTTLVGYSAEPDFELNLLQRPPEEYEKVYSREDKKGRYVLITLFRPFKYERFIFNWKGSDPPEGTSWSNSREVLDKLFAEGEIDISGRQPRRKRYLKPDQKFQSAPRLWDDLVTNTRKITGATGRANAYYFEKPCPEPYLTT